MFCLATSSTITASFIELLFRLHTEIYILLAPHANEPLIYYGYVFNFSAVGRNFFLWCLIPGQSDTVLTHGAHSIISCYHFHETEKWNPPPIPQVLGMFSSSGSFTHSSQIKFHCCARAFHHHFHGTTEWESIRIPWYLCWRHVASAIPQMLEEWGRYF